MEVLIISLLRMGDIYSAARDYLYVMQQRPHDEEAFMSFIQCLIRLKWYKEASSWLELYVTLFSNNETRTVSVQNTITQHQLTVEAEAISIESVDGHALKEEEKRLREKSLDYELRFVGHCNTTTDIKEANFLGMKLFCHICAGN